MVMVHRIIKTMRALAAWLLSGTENNPQPTIRLPRPTQNKDSTSDCLDARETAMPPKPQSQVTPHKVIEQQEDALHIEPSLPAKNKEVSKHLKKPREIGGRRKAHEQKTTTRHALKPRPELICRKDTSSWQWEVVLHVDDECQIKVVYQDGVALDKLNNEYSVLSLSHPLQITFESGEKEELPLFDGNPLIFKLRSGWKETGHKTSSIGKGHFVVFAPREWERTDPAPVEARSCTDKNFKANYFFGDVHDTQKDIGGFKQYTLPTKSIFELTGQRVCDDSDKGELFVGAVPNLKPLQAIAWVRIGEEKKDGWKGETFNTNEQSVADILGKREGHFFVRVYDRKATQLDSGEFRYLHDLKEVLVNGQPYDKACLLIPPPTGYSTISVSFISKNNTALRPILMHDTQHTKVRGGNLIVEAHPDEDSISCKLESNTGSVDLKLNLPRVWWKITSGKSDEWHSEPFVMTRQEFREHADINATIELRLSRQIRSVGIGFNDDLARKYQRIGQDDISVRMKDFSDYSQIDQRLKEDAMFNINCGEEVLTLIRIYADPVPTVTPFTCKPSVVYLVERVTEEMLPMWKQRSKFPVVVRKVNGGWRQGKGFSSGEIRNAGLAMSEATRHLIQVDKRRRTTHPNNTQTIRRLVDARC